MSEIFICRRQGMLPEIDPYPKYTYTGTSQMIDEGDGNWYIKFLTGGTLTFTSIGTHIDVYCCGGGGAGGGVQGGGGGGGYTSNLYDKTVYKDTAYEIVIGAGGVSAGNVDGYRGGTTSAFDNYAEGGYGGTNLGNGGKGGNGGSGGGLGNTNSSTAGASNGGSSSGTGQGRTTKAFEGTYTNDLYGSGGGGGGNWQRGAGYAGTLSGGGGIKWNAGVRGPGQDAGANTGAGGGGCSSADGGRGGNGGSGIVIIRNAR